MGQDGTGISDYSRGNDIYDRASDKCQASIKQKLLNDGWTVVTQDHSLSAQWEHTILSNK